MLETKPVAPWMVLMRSPVAIVVYEVSIESQAGHWYKYETLGTNRYLSSPPLRRKS